MILTYKFRIKDATVGKHLDRHARACNAVWNYCRRVQKQAQRRWAAGENRRWPSAFDLIKLCTGSAAELGLHSDTVQTICRQFTVSRDTHKRCPRYRESDGSECALGWIPVIPRAMKLGDGHVTYLKRKFYYWNSREIEGVFKSGSFVKDARGRWYVSIQCEIAEGEHRTGPSVGIDLGLKTLAVLSDGRKVRNPANFRRYEIALGIQQRAGNKRRVRAIHAKIANARKHFLHEQSTKIVRDYAYIAVGNVNSSKLARTRMAKSVLDAGWSSFRLMLLYKCQKAGSTYVEADERMTTRSCSVCGADSGPKGIAEIGVRHWDCSGCGTSHDRDVNAARNILRVGLERQPPVVEIPGLKAGEDVMAPSGMRSSPECRRAPASNYRTSGGRR
jgi:putative transposase